MSARNCKPFKGVSWQTTSFYCENFDRDRFVFVNLYACSFAAAALKKLVVSKITRVMHCIQLYLTKLKTITDCDCLWHRP